MDVLVQSTIQSCHLWQLNDKSAHLTLLLYSRLTFLTVHVKSWQLTLMAHFKNLHGTTWDTQHINVLTLVDYYSKWKEVESANAITTVIFPSSPLFRRPEVLKHIIQIGIIQFAPWKHTVTTFLISVPHLILPQVFLPSNCCTAGECAQNWPPSTTDVFQMLCFIRVVDSYDKNTVGCSHSHFLPWRGQG